MTQAALEAQKNTLLASAQPITATIHRSWGQQVINELYDSASRGKVIAGVGTVLSLASGDKIVIIRSGEAKLIDKDVFGNIGLSTVVTTGSNITLDFGLLPGFIFNGFVSFSAPKSILLSNNTNARSLNFFFSITNVAAVLTLPNEFKMDDIRWDDIAKTWTPDDIGRYKMCAVFDGNFWNVDRIMGPYK